MIASLAYLAGATAIVISQEFGIPAGCVVGGVLLVFLIALENRR
jgi:hypothetical protein